MTSALYDEVVTATPARTLHLVRDTSPTPTPTPTPAPAPEKLTRRVDVAPFGIGIGSDPLVEGAARLLSVPVRHVYAALWRVGLIEIHG
jgi:hypothetical protein